MVWVDDLETVLFDHYSSALTELAEKQAAMEEAEEEITPFQESSSSRNMNNTCTSSMTVHTQGLHVDVPTYKDLETTSPIQQKPKKLKCGQAPKSVTFQKEKLVSSKRKILNYNSEEDSENEEYQPGQLFKKHKQQKPVEEESEPEVELQVPKTKKRSAKKQATTSDEDSDQSSANEDDFTSMVANHARAHSLTMSTGKISQSILIKDDEGYTNISSPGERGLMLIKLELYPFKECVKLQKNQYWTKRTFSCMGLSSSKDSRVHKLAMKLRYEITKEIMKLKDVKVEKREQTGWKRF